MELKIQKSQTKNSSAFIISRLEITDSIQINITENNETCVFHIEIQLLRQILINLECFKLLPIEMKSL